ncbi:hypothetical protein A2313_03275 [Candidatus Roizmanbacteria bacterium RIFOXYB2_FULL_41_10]|uniref:VOC domain-containing protein n=1 Tax=Candidatus Roizmanbacteria bacterium RIFOXYA1_FULL_41_12 TaxID=1802082 RepID=A0A1F7KGF2_9BACT|nr:MAG: hypothetical protein A2262_02960 [Candidatus Roizmanbacteria bacterium RIFOXYA2_FULL_41_8]OGK66947.1 MAG: hypothetical protein A2209_02735 [Candidatus Roizmanbacteria bacterium RIFOXYA1_FULL_41_12]OGK67207.1 MAG: hypothetical protein A2377_01055 [Candidatus Roizmanbacteria bacterium RIFOXYB1_FULL_41_27]OGK72269.1 MAG: hypothetical protein A2313_03275 [Candidatus Roizmanbacteria bacterium RIFOXYB2_FULL_41_10]OGK72461.1 MAG: hypothetical protein A2403_03060 [Candidatus Roizmanbacteria bac
MDLKKVTAELKKQYPGKKIIPNHKTNPTEIICEVDPSSQHAGNSTAVAVIDQTKLHYHERSAEIYYVLQGKLELIIDEVKFVLNQDQYRVIPPGKTHQARGKATWVLVYSEPGWQKEDSLAVEDQSLTFSPNLTHIRLLVKDYQTMFRFYHEQLGLAVTWGDSKTDYAEFDLGDAKIAIYKTELMPKFIQTKLGKANGALVINLRVENLKTAVEFLKEQKIKPLSEITKYSDAGIEAFYLEDPEGNLLEIYRDLE